MITAFYRDYLSVLNMTKLLQHNLRKKMFCQNLQAQTLLCETGGVEVVWGGGWWVCVEAGEMEET